MNHRERLNDDEKLVIEVEYDDLTAYCGPECRGEVYVDDEQIGHAPTMGRDSVAPFKVDLVFHDAHPTKGEVKERLPQIEQECREEFDRKVDEVYERINESDEPLDAIMDLGPEDLTDEASK